MLNFPPFSYLLSETPLSVSLADSVRLLETGCGRYFYHDARLDVSIAQDVQSGAYVMVAGLAIDLREKSLCLEFVCRGLLSSLLSSEDVFFDHIDYIAGRFIVVYRRSALACANVISDATGMLKVNYAPGEKLLSSNVFLIDFAVNGGARRFDPMFKERRPLWKFGALGDRSPIFGVKILTPNHALRLDRYEVVRFYPRESIPEAENIFLVAGKIYEMCKLQQALLMGRYALCNSLTAGLDSRLSLAIAKSSANDQIFFTYFFEDSHFVDVKVADKIASVMHLQHCILVSKDSRFTSRLSYFSSPVAVQQDFPGLEADLKEWDWYGHGHRIVHSYKRDLVEVSQSKKEVLHIRSNLYEIGRAFWGAKRGRCNNPEKILEMSRKDWLEGAPEVFEKYFYDNDINPDAVHGVDLLDVFYWEHRCGTWVAEVLQATDFAFNTHSYVNCRKILELMLSVPFKERVSSALFKAIIAGNLTVIEGVPVNPEKF